MAGNDFMQQDAIDIHAHTGGWAGYTPEQTMLMNAGADVLVRRARACGIVQTVASSLDAFDPSPDVSVDVDAANAALRDDAERHEDLLYYTVITPKLPGWEQQADRMIDHPKCAGVKLHPRWNYWSVEEHGDRLFAFLGERKLLTLTHTGNEGNEPHRFIPFANRYPGVRLILAHIGHSEDGGHSHQIEAVRQSTQGNVWTDTSSIKSMIARLIERAVEVLGADRVVFGTDSPLYFAASQKARVAYADICDEDKRRVLYENAAQLLKG
ncbi:MAG: hypothetical protein CMJ18_25390 [Phycisphaeraceae bacterium]|nr:hypothetical protein [Phycisphaeraceae bacterium]